MSAFHLIESGVRRQKMCKFLSDLLNDGYNQKTNIFVYDESFIIQTSWFGLILYIYAWSVFITRHLFLSSGLISPSWMTCFRRVTWTLDNVDFRLVPCIYYLSTFIHDVYKKMHYLEQASLAALVIRCHCTVKSAPALKHWCQFFRTIWTNWHDNKAWFTTERKSINQLIIEQ